MNQMVKWIGTVVAMPVYNLAHDSRRVGKNGPTSSRMARARVRTQQAIASCHDVGYGYASGNEISERGVEVEVRKRSLAKALNSERDLLRKYGRDMANALRTRLGVLQNAPNLAAVPTHKPVRRHLLRAGRAGQFAVDLVHPYRLVFKPSHAPIPRRPDGGIDTARVTAITIIDVVDYH